MPYYLIFTFLLFTGMGCVGSKEASNAGQEPVSPSPAKSQVDIKQVVLVENTVEFMLTSNEGFYVGANEHILYIGDQSFHRYKQGNLDDQEGKSFLNYYIPQSKFNSLKDGAKMFLSYGRYVEGDEVDSNSYWDLGTFSSSMLKN